MQDIKLWISGLPSKKDLPAPLARALAQWQAQGSAVWMDVPAAMGALKKPPDVGLAWLYRAPWLTGGAPAQWLAQQRSVLRLRATQGTQLRIVNADAVDLATLAGELGLELPAVQDGAERAEHPSPTGQDASAAVAALMAKAYAWAAPDFWDVFEVLEAAASAPIRSPQVREVIDAPGLAALEAVETLLAAGATAPGQLGEVTARLTALEQSAAAQKSSLEQALADAHSALAKAEATASSTATERDTALKACANAQAQAAEAAKESELLLLQLHQVQEELEQFFLKSRDQQGAADKRLADGQAALERAEAASAKLQIDLKARTQELERAKEISAKTADASKAALEEARASAAQAHRELHERLQTVHRLQGQLQMESLAQRTLREERDALLSEVDALSAAHAQALHAHSTAMELLRAEGLAAVEAAEAQTARFVEGALQQHAQELERLRSENRDELDTLQAGVAEVCTDRDTAKRLLAETQAALDGALVSHKAALDKMNAAYAATQKDKQDRLLHLHQLQGELQTHYLQRKTAEQERDSLSTRLKRVLVRHPQALDFGSVRVAAADAAAPLPAVDWEITSLAVAGQLVPELKCRTTLHEGLVGVELLAPQGGSAAAGPLVPGLLVRSDAAQLARFRALSAQDWLRLLGATAVLERVLSQPRELGAVPVGFDAAFWCDALKSLPGALRGLPPMFRFDTVRLKREKCNPDYEHLWLTFGGSSYGAREMPGFELRLSAAEVLPGGFSQLPKLELPLTDEGTPPFEGWFEESRDDYGPKLELRANLKLQAFDLAVWARLPEPAKALLLSVIAALPAALKRLAAGDVRLARPWPQWEGLLAGLIAVMRKRLATPAGTPKATSLQTRAPAVAAPQLAAATSSPRPPMAPAARSPMRLPAEPPIQAVKAATAASTVRKQTPVKAPAKAIPAQSPKTAAKASKPRPKAPVAATKPSAARRGQ